jgi:hypothetical protein
MSLEGKEPIPKTLECFNHFLGSSVSRRLPKAVAVTVIRRRRCRLKMIGQYVRPVLIPAMEHYRDGDPSGDAKG